MLWLFLRWLFLGWLLLGWLLLTYKLNKTPLGETGSLVNPCFLLTDCLDTSSFLIHPLSQHSQLGYLWLPTPHCAALMPFHWSPSASQPLPRKAEDFPRGGKHSNHVPLLTYLA